MIIQIPEFNHVMTRDAKKLRDTVIEDICIKYGTANKGQSFRQSFIQDIVKVYNPLNWEAAILYGYWKQIYESVARLTSKRYNDQINKSQVRKETWAMGSVDGPRNKNVDWVDLAKFDSKWYYGHVQWYRDNAVKPSAFSNNYNAFDKVYRLFINWLIVDFSYKTLYTIWVLSTKYSLDEIKRCMDMIIDPSKRSVEYLVPIIDREQALLRNELEENRLINETSKNTIKSILDIVNKDSDPIDWNDIDSKRTIDSINIDEFKDIKLS